MSKVFTDHRGKPVRPLSLRRVRTALRRARVNEHADAVLALTTLEAQTEHHLDNTAYRNQATMAFCIALSFLLALFIGGALASTYRSSTLAVVLSLSAPALVLALGFYQLHRMRLDTPSPASVSLLRYSLCPACAEELATEHSESDGCVSCKGCGAAWRVTEAPDTAMQLTTDSVLGWVVDHSKRRQPVLDPRAVLPQEQADEVMRFTKSDRAEALRAAVLVGVASLGIIAVALWPIFTPQGWAGVNMMFLVIALVMAAIAIWQVVVVWQGKGTHSHTTVARRLLDLRICPACGTADIQPETLKPKLLHCAACDAKWHATRQVWSADEG